MSLVRYFHSVLEFGPSIKISITDSDFVVATQLIGSPSSPGLLMSRHSRKTRYIKGPKLPSGRVIRMKGQTEIFCSLPSRSIQAVAKPHAIMRSIKICKLPGLLNPRDQRAMNPPVLIEAYLDSAENARSANTAATKRIIFKAIVESKFPENELRNKLQTVF